MEPRRSIAAAALVLALPATASAHVLSEDDARDQAEEVASFVAGVLTTEYRLREYGVKSCSRESDQRVACKGYWKVKERESRTRWTCTAQLLVWLDDPESDETDLDYDRLRCKRTKKRRRHPGAAAR
jgi:hypothetical protein